MINTNLYVFVIGLAFGYAVAMINFVQVFAQ